jgi:peptidase Do
MKLLATFSLAILVLASSVSCAQSSSNLSTASVPQNENLGAFTTAAESTVNSVVSIKSFASMRSRGNYRGYSGDEFFSDPFFDFFFGTPQRRQPQRRQLPQSDSEESQQQLGLGSGVIISADGYIVTNNHVIDGADRLEVTLNDNRSFNATVIGSDPTTDLALIKIDAEDLPVLPMGNSDDLKLGQWVLAVGNPFGLNSTVTAGIVSAKARSLSAATHGRPMGIESYIQTDAAVNPGNSGGALVNLAGELVGINTAIYSQTGNYAGYSFAIPTSIVKKIVSDIQQYGTVQRAVLGVEFVELTPKLAKEKNITAVNAGIYVLDVVERSAAMEAGLKSGDVIVAVDGHETDNGAKLQEIINRYHPGDKVTVKYIRDNKAHTATATLYNSQGSTKVTKASDISALGCKFKPLDEDVMRQLRISSGVEVTDVSNGKAKDAGIKDGFIILTVNNQRISSPEDISKIYNSVIKSLDQDKVMFIIGIYPTGRKAYYVIDLADNN